MSHPSAEAFEDGIDLQIGLLEAYLPSSQTAWPGYPFLPLKPSGEQEMRTFRTIILENPYLRATILPGLGGRIISLFDKRTGSEILRRHPMIEPHTGGTRGVYVREGVQIWLGDEERLNSLGNVATQFEHNAEEDSGAAVWLAETFTGSGLSFHLRVSIPPDRAELLMEARVLNRWLRPQSYNGGIGIYLGEGTFDGSTFYSRDRNVGLAVFSDSQTFDGVDFSEGVVRFARFGASKPLTGRQVDSWSLRLVPLSGIGGCLGASSEAAASVEEGTLKIQVSEQRLGNKLLMLTEDSQTLEAIVDLYPEHVLEIPLGGLKPIEFVLRDPGKNEILRVSGNPTTYEPRPAIITDVVPKRRREDGAHLSTSTSVEDLMRATFEVSQRHLAFTILGLKALATQRHADAEAAFEQALNYNAEDPLLWWGKAVAARLDGKENEAEVLNAHYLAPLEPALRAESYLAQPISLDPEPNRLLAPLEENPEEFIEVACLLIEAGMHDQASRWLDEAIRHRDLPMLRYLMAYCLVVKTRLNAEASEQVRVAGKTPLVPPFPFRDLERTAILTLSETFPSDQRLAVLAGYVNTLDL